MNPKTIRTPDNRPALPKIHVNYKADTKELTIRDEQGQKITVHENLIKHALGIPYTKKNGQKMTAKDIEAAKKKAQEAYDAAVERNRASGQ